MSYVYDNAGRREKERFSDNGGLTAREISYAMDANGNTVGITWPDSPTLVAGYEYNALNLVSKICKTALVGGECPSGGHYAHYQYDELGRRDWANLGDGRTAR